MAILQKLLHRYRRWELATSRWDEFLSVKVGISWWCQDVEVARGKVQEALTLIARYAPLRLRRLRLDVQSIAVLPITYNWAEWHQCERQCVLNLDFVESDEASVERLAATIIHEATHARICRFGFSDSEDLRWRIERLCLLQEIRLLRRLPGATGLVEEIQRMRELPPEFWEDSNMEEQKLEFVLEEVRRVRMPVWLVKGFEKWIRKRMEKRRLRPKL